MNLKGGIKQLFRLIVKKPVLMFNLLLITTFVLILYLLASQVRLFHQNQLLMTPSQSVVENVSRSSTRYPQYYDRFMQNRHKAEVWSDDIENGDNAKKIEEILSYLSSSTTSNKFDDRQSSVHNDAGSRNWFDILQETAQKMYQIFSPNLHLQDFRKWAVEKQRRFLQAELNRYKLFDKTKKWDDLMMEKGGQPIRNAIFTTWRSGSTFLAEVVEALPGTFYHYEPLLHFGIVRVRSGSVAKEGIRVIRDLFNCEYSNISDYVKYGEDHHWLFSHNNRVWQYCEENHQVCSDAAFLSNMCRMFPVQILKTVRMRLKLAKSFLDDPKLNLKLLLLVRDPRGTLQSRRHREWCPGNEDCESPASLCSDLEDDFKTAKKFRKAYPGRFMTLRYEDISLNPYSAVKKLFNFFELKYDSRIDTYLDNHTVVDLGGVSSTFRDSKNAPFHWRQDLAAEFDQVEKIQSYCSKAMALWGYKPALNNNHLLTFNPLDKPPWSDMNIEQDKLLNSSFLEP